MFSGGEPWATNEPARDRSGAQNYDTEIKGLLCRRFDLDYIKVFGFQTDHR